MKPLLLIFQASISISWSNVAVVVVVWEFEAQLCCVVRRRFAGLSHKSQQKVKNVPRMFVGRRCKVKW